MPLALTQKSGQLAQALVDARQAAKSSLGQDARETTGVQHLGLVTSLAGQTYRLFYDPSADAIIYDTGNPSLNAQ